MGQLCVQADRGQFVAFIQRRRARRLNSALRFTQHLGMTAFSSAIDAACEGLAAELGRDLHSDEIEEIEDKLLRAWIDTARFNELIEYARDEFELRDGEVFCSSLGSALCRTKNSELARDLFSGLALAREAAFWRVWPQAQAGHIGAMKEAANHLANSLKALSELYRCYSALGNGPGMAQVQAEMLRLQARKKSEA